MSKAVDLRMAPAEVAFQRQILVALNADPRRGLFWRQNSGVIVHEATASSRGRVFRGAPPGAADIVGIASPDGLHVEVEVKVGAAWTTKQHEWQKRVLLHGGVYVLVRYDRKLWPVKNIARTVELVDVAISDRRQLLTRGKNEEQRDDQESSVSADS